MTDIPPKVLAFLTTYIRSTEELELLLLLQSRPQNEWTASEISWLLSMDPVVVSAHLHTLAENAMLVATQEEGSRCYRFEPLNSDIAEAVSTLAKIYSRHKRRITSLIGAQPQRT